MASSCTFADQFLYSPGPTRLRACTLDLEGAAEAVLSRFQSCMVPTAEELPSTEFRHDSITSLVLAAYRLP